MKNNAKTSDHSSLNALLGGWKRMNRWTRRLLVTFGSLLLIILLTSLWGCCKPTASPTEEYEWVRTYSRDVVEHYFPQRNKSRLFNEQTNCYTTPYVDWFSGPAEGGFLAVYAQEGKRGFFHTQTGEIVINAQENNYTKAWVFSEGLAAVVQEGKIGFINPHNEVEIPFQFTDYGDTFTYQPAHLFYQGLCKMTNAEGKCGLINKEGNWVVEPIYDALWAPDDAGYRTITRNGSFGLIKSDGTLLREPTYDYFCSSTEEGDLVCIKDGAKWQEDVNGKMVHPFIVTDTWTIYHPQIVSAWASSYAGYTVAAKSGIMSLKTGKPITKAIFESIDMVSEDLFVVQSQRVHGEQYYLINNKGEEVGPLSDRAPWLLWCDNDNCLTDYAEYYKLVGSRYLSGVFDRHTGRIVVEPLYEEVVMLSFELFKAKLPDTYYWVILDQNGKEVGL